MHRRNRARSALLVCEVALSLMLLVGAGLLIKSFLRLREVQPGFNPNHVATMSISLPYVKYREDQQRTNFFRDLTTRVSALPGVEASSAALTLPLGGSDYAIGRSFVAEGRALTTEESANASYCVATPKHFRTLGIPLRAGRDFSERDDLKAPMVAVVNETLARHYFGSPQSALGKRLTIWRDEKFPREIVGVVGDTKTSTLDQAAEAQIYVPQAQDPSWNFLTLAIRTKADSAAIVPAVRQQLRELDKDQPIYNLHTMEEVVARSVASRRVSMLLFSLFSGVALGLAAIGIYGVIAYAVAQRTREIGIRMALGAQARDILKLVVGQGMTLALLGVGVGIVGALALTRLLASLLFGVSANDPVTFAAIALLLTLVALTACYLPARRAAKLNPVTALAVE